MSLINYILITTKEGANIYSAEESKANEILKIYDQFFKVKQICPFKVIVTENIYSTRLKLCNSESERHDVKLFGGELQNYHGLLVEPDEHDSIFYLLISNQRFDESNIYSQTVSHEYTHLIDYFEYKKNHNILNMREIQFCPDYECFSFYSEVRARFRGSVVYYAMTKFDKESLFHKYQNQLVPDYGEILNNNIRGNMYMLAQFYGQHLAVSLYTNTELNLPGYIIDSHVRNLLLQIDENITNTSIFDNYSLVSSAYNDFISKYKKDHRVENHF